MKKVRFPKDEAVHSKGSEWWYFNGYLKSEDNKEYSLMASFFKMDMMKNRPKFFLLPIKVGYLIHGHILDIKKKKFYPFYKHFIQKPHEKFTEKKFLCNHYRLASLKEFTKGIYHLYIKNKKYVLDLIIKAEKPPVLHGKKGLIDIGKGYSYYYSFTDMSIRGTLKIGDKIKQVEGIAWMDHQWGNFDLHDKQWDWLSIKLKNDIDIMAFKILDKITQEVMLYTSLIDKNGKSKIIKDAKLKSTKNWKSRKTGIIYPLYWNLKIPSKKINLTIKPVFNEQEMHDGILKYWEGCCKVTGTFNKKRTKGRAYIELVGHERLKSKLF
ncbi:hypothetical protein KY343_02905 [Candidatus Woesearchaeota archaeon]|nr:hypothetical protein [Candidatus Woesearchaeota archaeon]